MMKSKQITYWLTGIGMLLTLSFYQCTKKSTGQESAATDEAKPNLSTQAITTFVHPGVLNTAASLDFIRNQANDGSSTRFADYNNTVVAFIDSHAIPTSFPATVVAKASGTTPTETQIKSDAILAYALALRWAKTADPQWAAKTIQVLDGWSQHFQNYSLASGTPSNQPYLEASWVAPSFVAAAEIIRWYHPAGQSANWSAAGMASFESFMNNLKNNYINNVVGQNFNNNWNVSAGYAKMAIGVYLGSVSVYQGGVDIINNVLPHVINANGTMPELCDRNDCVHFQYSLTGLSYAAQISLIQHDTNLFLALSSRINAGYGYMKQAYANAFPSCASCAGKPVFPGVEVANKFYNNSTTQALRNTAPPYSVPNDNTFLGFTTYTHFAVSVQ
jgi:hypothetical protein